MEEKQTYLEPQTPAQKLSEIKILLAEDNLYNVMILEEELEEAIEGVSITVAKNGQEALDQLVAHDFDIVLMDVRMPQMDGYQATRAIRQLDGSKSQIPIIALTANVMKDEINRCLEAGMDDFSGKPFEVGDLLEKMGGLVRG